MSVIQIGSLAIMLKWLLLGSAVLIGLLVVKWWLKRTQVKENSKEIFDTLTNSLFILILVWKASLIVLEPKLILKSPISILYFTGGTKGLVLAIVITLIYFIYKNQRAEIPIRIIGKSILIFVFTVLSFYQVSHTLVTSYKSKEGGQVKEAATASKDLEIGLQEGNMAPNFALKSLEGKEIKLSDMAGKKVILNFWATWCPPCKAEMPHMQEFYEEHNNEQVTILAVNLTNSEKNNVSIGSFVKDYKLTFPVVLDSEGQVGQTYQAVTIPTSYIIDTKGVIQKKIIGPMDKEMMKDLIESLE